MGSKSYSEEGFVTEEEGRAEEITVLEEGTLVEADTLELSGEGSVELSEEDEETIELSEGSEEGMTEEEGTLEIPPHAVKSSNDKINVIFFMRFW